MSPLYLILKNEQTRLDLCCLACDLMTAFDFILELIAAVGFIHIYHNQI